MRVSTNCRSFDKSGVTLYTQGRVRTEDSCEMRNGIAGNNTRRALSVEEFRAFMLYDEVADSWLCAHALTFSYTIVTEETHERDSKRKVKIPNMCENLGLNI